MIMPSLTAPHLTVFRDRIRGLAPDTKPRWGRMDATLMIRHLRRALEISMGEIEVPDRSIPGLRSIIRVLFFYVFTIWPPSRARLPKDWLPPAEHTFAVEKDLLLQALDRFVQRLDEQPGKEAVHTLLGPLTLRSWSRVHGVHFNHHFRQFRLVWLLSFP